MKYRPNNSERSLSVMKDVQPTEEHTDAESRLRKNTIMWASLSIQLQSELGIFLKICIEISKKILAKRHKYAETEKELKKRAEKINLEIGLLIAKKVKEFSKNFPLNFPIRHLMNLLSKKLLKLKKDYLI